MFFNVKNETGSNLTINGTVVAAGSTIDLVPIWALGNFADQQNDIDGSNAGRSISGLMIRDFVTAKHSLNFVSAMLDHDSAVALRNLLSGTQGVGDTHKFTVTTDMFDSTSTAYQMYSNNRVLTHIYGDLYKVSCPIVEK